MTEAADMRIAMDATPLLGQRSGVGRYVAGLLDGLAELDDGPDVRLVVLSLRGSLPRPLPRGSKAAPGRAPARLLRHTWGRWSWPPVQMLSGPVDVVHGTNFVLPPARAAHAVVTLHDLTFLRYPDAVTTDVARYSTLVPMSLRRADRVVTVTRAVADEVIAEYGLSAEQVVVAHNGVAREWFEPTVERPVWLPARYVLFVGNLEPRKNLKMLVEAHRRAREEGDVPPLLLVGAPGWGNLWGGHPPDERHVRRVGFLADAELRAVVSGASAVCAPSTYEGFGLPVLEAMATGVRVLASDIAAHREIHGGLAHLICPDDVDGWAQALVDMPMTDSATEREARQRHAAMFTWKASAHAHIGAYTGVVGPPGQVHPPSAGPHGRHGA